MQPIHQERQWRHGPSETENAESLKQKFNWKMKDKIEEMNDYMSNNAWQYSCRQEVSFGTPEFSTEPDNRPQEVRKLLDMSEQNNTLLSAPVWWRNLIT